MAKDPEQLAHLEWLGYVQPVGLVVSIPALLAAQAHVNRNITPDHQRFLACLPRDKNDEVIPEIRDLPKFACTVMGWEPADLSPIPRDATLASEFGALEVALPEYHETLRPSYAVREFEPKEGRPPWIMLVQELPTGTDFDEPIAATDRNWHASPHSKFERLLRETEIPAGLLVNGTHLRLVYAPRGETSGYVTFSVAEMTQVAGRPMFAGLHMLLCAERLYTLPEKQRLPAILAESRKYQNTVSTQLANQVLAALFELLRGFQAADDQRHGDLLRDVLADDPNHVYHGLLTVLMRLVFVLYAEDRGMMPGDPVYGNFYSVTGLFERLRADAGRYPDTMDLRYGAWAQLLTLSRMIYEGGRHGGFRIPTRKGYLFDPDRYPFLEGRPRASRYCDGPKPQVPHVSDGVLFRVLNNLLILDGERLSYRSLDVEQIGSVYEAVMGFYLEVAQGPSIAIKPAKSHGAPATINLEALLEVKAKDRAKWLKDKTDQKLTGQAGDALKNAQTVDDLLAALDRKIARNVTPNEVQAGAMVFQPSDERRRSGSHYTPRSLTEPIVRTTLRPVLERLRASSPLPPGECKGGGARLPSPANGRGAGGEGCPTPDQILDLNVCDPAMGSGAFLVETCRQLGDELVKAWHIHNRVPILPPDEDEVLHARRLIAQQCVYGVDKNPMAVDLAKLSLWLATLAKDHPFTFLDHSLRCGDSLVGLTREQISAFHWAPPPKRSKDDVWFGDPIAERMKTVTEYRQRILAARDQKPYEQLRQELDLADEALGLARLAGDCVIAAYFSAQKEKDRKMRLDQLARQLVKYLGPQGRVEDRQPLAEAVAELHSGEHPIQPFHWDIEFPEVFGGDNPGFDAIVGNPPFAGKNTIISSNPNGYLDWLKLLHQDSHGNSDLVAHFFRSAFTLLRYRGAFGLIATNTIAQGDTRATGLRWICNHGGNIYAATRRYKWPGQAAVNVSIVHIRNGTLEPPYTLDGRAVSLITAYLFSAGSNDNPQVLVSNTNKSFIGSYILGMGFTFDDTAHEGIANPIDEMHRLIRQNPSNAERIFPFIGGEEINDSPTHSFHRYVINFADMTEQEARRWPDLMSLLERRVRPERMKLGDNGDARRRKANWWLWGRYTPALFQAVHGLQQVLVNSQVTAHLVFAFVPSNWVYAHGVDVYALDRYSWFAALQSRPHEVWARFFASSLEDRLRYNTSDCFETFPFPDDCGNSPQLEAVGSTYYSFRAQLMVANNRGLTKTYNLFNDPNNRSPDILRLRELHAAMDRAVLETYGWHDLAENATCDFLLDYEQQEENEEEASSKQTGRKKPWRYRWPDDFRDEVLARLLELNKQRAEEERLAGLTAETGSGKPKGRAKKATGGGRKTKRNYQDSDQTNLPGM